METLRNCQVVFQDDIHNPLEGAQVQIEGDGGQGTVTISRPDFNKKRMVRVDQLKSADWNNRKGTYTFTGRSQHLAHVIGTRDATLTVQVTPEVPRKSKV